jgi:hypothetical protein
MKFKLQDLLVSQTDKSSFISGNGDDYQKNINVDDGKSIGSGYGTTTFHHEQESNHAY